MSKVPFGVLILFSLLIITTGIGFIGYGLRPQISLKTQSNTLSVVGSTPEATISGTYGVKGEQVLVTEVIDGDTIKIAGNITVRFLGIDTPETKDPRKSVQCFGKESSNKLKELIEGKEVILEKDVSQTDIYKRLLRYIYLPLENNQLLFVNDYLIREGFAKALTYPPDVKYTDQFLEAQQEAKEKNKGLWGRC